MDLRGTSVIFEIDQAGAVFLQARVCRYEASTVQMAEINENSAIRFFFFLGLVLGTFTNLVRS